METEPTDQDWVQFRIDAGIDGGRRSFWPKVDRADWPAVEPYTWHVVHDGRNFYPATTLPRDGDTRRRWISLGRFLMGEGELGNLGRIDHRNGNGLDCRRANLRIVTQSRILAKRRPPEGGASRYKGVTWEPDKGRWCVAFRGRKVGRFDVEEDAARAFDEAALAEWGEDAYLNFPVRKRTAALTGARARLLAFAADACLDTREAADDPDLDAALRTARDAVYKWTLIPASWPTNGGSPR